MSSRNGACASFRFLGASGLSAKADHTSATPAKCQETSAGISSCSKDFTKPGRPAKAEFVACLPQHGRLALAYSCSLIRRSHRPRRLEGYLKYPPPNPPPCSPNGWGHPFFVSIFHSRARVSVFLPDLSAPPRPPSFLLFFCVFWTCLLFWGFYAAAFRALWPSAAEAGGIALKLDNFPELGGQRRSSSTARWIQEMSRRGRVMWHSSKLPAWHCQSKAGLASGCNRPGAAEAHTYAQDRQSERCKPNVPTKMAETVLLWIQLMQLLED